MGDQLLIGAHRMRLMRVIESAESVVAGCRLVDVHPSTYYAWRKQFLAEGPQGLVPVGFRSRALSPWRVRLEAQVVATALANPPWGPRRLFGELVAQGIEVGSESQVWRILVRHRINTRQLRYKVMLAHHGVVEGEAATGPIRAPHRSFVGRLDAENPGDLVQMDCFHIGALKETRIGSAKLPGVLWQYTAIDVASSYVWAQLHTTAHNPAAVHTTALVHQIASDMARWGWVLRQISTDRGSEFRANQFSNTLGDYGINHRFIAAGRPQSNGKVEQVQRTISDEFWKPVFTSYQQPSITGLRQDLNDYLHYYNHHRPHYGRWNQGKPPTQIIHPKQGNQP